MDDQDELPVYNARISVVSQPPDYPVDTRISVVSQPPGYFLNAHQNDERLAPARAAPSESSNPPLTKEFTYDMKTFMGKTWAKLSMQADGRLSRDTPVFVEGSIVPAKVTLALGNREAISSVFIFLKGTLITSGDPRETHLFMYQRTIVWMTSMGNPRSPSADNPPKWKEKLRGDYEWPVEIKLPKFTTRPADSAGMYRLPHSFSDPKTPGSVLYEIGLYVHRDGKLRPDDSLKAPFGYFTIQQPTKPSVARLLAYTNNATAPGPFEDPSGWYPLELVRIQGRVFGDRDVDIQCQLFLGRPLCYTRTTAIPCALTFEGSDSQALDLFGSIKTSALYLQRRVICTYKVDSTHVQPCGKANWWPSTDAAAPRDPQRRHLMGELIVAGNLAPSTTIKFLRVEYSVVLFPPDVTAFEPQDSGPLATQPVEIVTRFAPGPRQPRSRVNEA
ncbi:hypothetical protein C8F01DRAFT_497347 [Mycena amicta]|nr:hypothetical protein C8F01DRAFT_497347 [Mycena amicta]